MKGTTLKYQLRRFQAGLVWYYAIILSIILGFAIMFKIFGGDGSINNMEFNSAIYLFVVGIVSHKENLRFFLANGLTRKQLFVSLLASSAIVALGMAVVDTAIGLLLNAVVNYDGFINASFNLIYPNGSLVSGVLFLATMNFLIHAIGYLIANLYYVCNTLGKILLSISIPAFLLIGIPVIDGYLFSFQILNKIGEFLMFALGLPPIGNPFYAITFFTISALAVAAVSYLFVRRAVIKEA